MSYLSQFDKDFFISYAHLDDATPDGKQDGWITYFHKSLEFRVAQLFGTKPRIWRDLKLQGNDFFGDEIVDQFPRVAFLISVLSPRYVKSEWCLREVDEFCKAAQQNIGIRIKNKARIFKVVKTPIPLEQHPGVLGELLGYEFYKYDPDSRTSIAFDRIVNPDAEKDFWRVLNDLAHDIADLLQTLQQNGTTGATPQRKSIYLADTGSDLKEARDEIKRELESQDFLVLPDRQLPFTLSEYLQDVEQMLSRSECSIHLIGKNRGIVPDGADRSIIELQNELAARKSDTSAFKRLIWLPPGLQALHEEHQRFIQFLRTDRAGLVGADLLEAPLDAFKVELQLLLQPKPEPEQQADRDDDEVLRRIYLIHDQRDREAVVALDDYLYDQEFEVILPAFEGDVKQLRQDHEENLRFSDAVLIYYGAANVLWLRAKLREMSKIAGQGRTREFLAKYIYVAGPKTPEKERYRTREAEVIKHFESFTPESLAPFVAQLKQTREGAHDR